jgi:3D (Asp-Asp-Asp) domain-containing protein
VGQLLERLNLEIGEQDVLSHDLQDQTFSGMQLRVDSVITRRETYTSTLTYETVTCLDDSLPEGSREILVEGRDGELLCTADVTYINGVEAERQVLSRDVTIAPVTEVIGKGTGEIPETAVDPRAMPIIGDGYILLPTGEVLTYTHTMICNATSYCDKGITATGTRSRVGAIAVDPKVIPYGTRMFIVTNDGEYIYGIATAEDTGHPNHISGNRIDLFFDTLNECIIFGYRECTVYFLGSESAE